MKRKKLTIAFSLLLGLALGVMAEISGRLGEGRYKLVGLFSQVVSLVRSNYVDEVPISKLEEGALAGLVTSADPQGTWVPNHLWADFAAYFQHPLPPFGLVVGLQSSYPVVLQVLPGSAAAEAHILPGELIERVEEQPVRARPLWRIIIALEQAFKKGRGVKLEVIARDLSAKRTVLLPAGHEGEPFPVSEQRGPATLVRIPVINEFYVKKMMPLLADKGPLVVDLRGTSLGEPQGVVEAAALLVGGETRLTLTGRNGDELTVRASKPPVGRKVVVCVDHTTAKAGEWLAFLLAQRGVQLVGVETFGDTGWREAISASDGKLWVAKKVLFNPEGSALLGKGLKPTVLVRPQEEGDPILQKALELASGEEKPEAA